MTGKKLRVLALVMVLFMAAPIAFSLMGAEHACEGQECLICAAIRRSVMNIVAVLMVGMGVVLCAKRVICCPADRESILLPTPVGTCVRLND